jgi:hypothetical protein
MEDRKPPTTLCVMVILGTLVCYGLGLGPACWVSSRVGGTKVVTAAYRPVTFAAEVTGSVALMDAIRWFSGLGASGFHEWMFSPDAPGHAEWAAVPFIFADVDVDGFPDITYPLAPEEPPESSSSQ